jgi:hypothetical protein
MEELPSDKNNRGIFDRSFIHYFIKDQVAKNIKDVLKDQDSQTYKNLIHLRKLLFTFRLKNFDFHFPKIKTNLEDRDVELTSFLLRMSYGGKNFDMIKRALAKMLYAKTYSKSNSIEAMITETIQRIIESEEDKNKIVIEFSNDIFEMEFRQITEAKDNAFDIQGSTFYLPDGTKISKYRLSRLLTSKFKAKPLRTNQFRGYRVNKNDIEKISKQYRIIDEIKVLDVDEKVTEVTQVTEFKGVFSPSGMLLDVDHGGNDCEIHSNLHIQNTASRLDNNTPESIQDLDNNRSNKYGTMKENSQSIINLEPKACHTPSNRVTSVTSVTAVPPQFPCYFCGNNYKTNIDFDMGNHFLEKHKDQLSNYPIPGNREIKIDYVIAETKRRLSENFSVDDKEIDQG